MGMFRPDLYRSFAVGFAVGAALILLASFPQWKGDIATPAQAATAAVPADTVPAPGE